MTDLNVSLATLIGSRICHDLISPIGAITNGLELLDLTGQAEGPEFDLIAESVASAGARIRFFRIAYGAAGDQMLGRLEIDSVLKDISQSGRLKAHWDCDAPQPRAMVRLAFLALQCCETAMPYGGSVVLDVTGDSWSAIGTSQKITFDSTLWARLRDPDGLEELSPAQVQFALLPRVAADLGRRITVEQGETEIAIRF